MNLNNKIKNLKKNIIQVIDLKNSCIEYQIVSLDHTYSKRYLEKKYSTLLKTKLKNNLQNIKTITTTHTIIKDKLYIIVIGSSDLLGIGVDLEFKFRVVNSRLKERITIYTERKYNISTLEYWIIKEASFKSCYPNNKGHILKDYKLIDWDTHTKKGKVCSKYGVEIIVYIFSIESFLVGIAKVNKKY